MLERVGEFMGLRDRPVPGYVQLDVGEVHRARRARGELAMEASRRRVFAKGALDRGNLGFRQRPIHEAVREDAAEARAWADRRVKRTRDAIRDEPMRATLYALGIGVIIGLLAAR